MLLRINILLKSSYPYDPLFRRSIERMVILSNNIRVRKLVFKLNESLFGHVRLDFAYLNSQIEESI